MNLHSFIASIGFNVDHASKKVAVGAISEVGGVMQKLGLVGGGLGSIFAAKQVFDYTSAMEMLTTQFAVMTGSMRESRDMMRDIRQMAQVTPFETVDLAGAGRLMMTFGAETKDVLGYLNLLGDATMGDKVRFNQMSLAFSQMLAAGKLMGQDLLQMTTAGYNPLRTIADTLGIQYQDTIKMMARDQITPDMVIAALQKDTGVGGKFYQGMIEGAKTLNGLWSTIKDNAMNTGLSLGNMLLPSVKELFAGTILWINEAGASIRTFFGYIIDPLNRIIATFQEVGRGAILLVEQFAPAAITIFEMITYGAEAFKQNLVGAFWAIAPLLETIVEGAQDAAVMFGLMAQQGNFTFRGFFESLRNIATILSPLMYAIVKLITAVLIGTVRLAGIISKYFKEIGALLVFAIAVKGGFAFGSLISSMAAASVTAGGLQFAMLGVARSIWACVAAMGPLALAWVGVSAAVAGAVYLISKYIDKQNETDEHSAKQEQLNFLEKRKEDIIAKRRFQESEKGWATRATPEWKAANQKKIDDLKAEEDELNRMIYKTRFSTEGGKKGSLGLFDDWDSLMAQFTSKGDSNMQKLIDQMSADMARRSAVVNNKIEINTTVDDKGKTQLSPEALEHSLDKAMRSLFDLKVINAANIAL